MKIHIWAQQWLERRCMDSRVEDWSRQCVACVKHFAGSRAAEGGRDYDSSYIPEI